MDDFIIVEWSNGKRKLYKATCSTCGINRGYKKPSQIIGNCKSCQKRINAGTLGIIKECIQCRSTEVPDPTKQWFAGPTCYRCRGKEYRKENKEKIKANIDAWRLNNKERHQETCRKWRIDHKEHKNTTDTTWREANKDRWQNSQREYIRNKLKTDPCFKIAHALRHRLNEALKTSQKVGSAVRDLGCTIEELKQRLESMFYPNLETGEIMTWENHTIKGWHIDHIKPLDSFDLSNKEQLLKACHYTNLQPLWWHDNIRKGAK